MMALNHIIFSAVFLSMLSGCSAGEKITQVEYQQTKLMKAEFLEHCDARPEYISRKRAGTLEKHCNCIFDKTMKGLESNERVIAAFYLYGETHEAFRKRENLSELTPDGMMAAVKAVAQASKACP